MRCRMLGLKNGGVEIAVYIQTYVSCDHLFTASVVCPGMPIKFNHVHTKVPVAWTTVNKMSRTPCWFSNDSCRVEVSQYTWITVLPWQLLDVYTEQTNGLRWLAIPRGGCRAVHLMRPDVWLAGWVVSAHPGPWLAFILHAATLPSIWCVCIEITLGLILAECCQAAYVDSPQADEILDVKKKQKLQFTEFANIRPSYAELRECVLT